LITDCQRDERDLGCVIKYLFFFALLITMSLLHTLKLGDLTPTRDFNYVKDTARGFLALAECDETIGKEINIASSTEISMADTLNLIKEIMLSDVRFIIDEQRLRPKDSEVFRLLGDNKLIKQLTGWQPEYSLKQGFQETIAWFNSQENLRKYKPGLYNL
jgi:nucleoside-diphosphate-sugar epimerase